MANRGQAGSTAPADHLLQDPAIGIDQKLIEEGTAQLASEIQVLETWLQELESSDDSDLEVAATRKSYHDMLRSRKQMLSTLARQTRVRLVAE